MLLLGLNGREAQQQRLNLYLGFVMVEIKQIM